MTEVQFWRKVRFVFLIHSCNIARATSCNICDGSIRFNIFEF